jgi:hypothetical protein
MPDRIFLEQQFSATMEQGLNAMGTPRSGAGTSGW